MTCSSTRSSGGCSCGHNGANTTPRCMTWNGRGAGPPRRRWRSWAESRDRPLTVGRSPGGHTGQQVRHTRIGLIAIDQLDRERPDLGPAAVERIVGLTSGPQQLLKCRRKQIADVWSAVIPLIQTVRELESFMAHLHTLDGQDSIWYCDRKRRLLCFPFATGFLQRFVLSF